MVLNRAVWSPRQPGQNGRPPLKGARRPSLKVLLDQPQTTRASAAVAWYDSITRTVELTSWTTLAAHVLQDRSPMTQRTAAWYDKPSPTFVDAIALVRRRLWLASEGFSLSVADPDIQELPVALFHRLVDSLAYAA